ncbi:MAG: hypothetical protein A2Z17_06880 [Gammaproteobacteria bacterium RBG_16_66_13]|nr:MAG: hypothetical protein A2Z17_06880 [Gammaproteobacteria bacterium RBG_16_66_13]
MKIRITEAGVGKVILARSDWPEGEVLTVPKYDGDFFVREGWAELMKDEPAKEPEPEEEAAPQPEAATAEPAGETATQERPSRRRGS